MFLLVFLLCSSLDVRSCVMAQDTSRTYPTETVCYEAGHQLALQANKKGLLLLPYCIKVVGEPV